MRHARATNCQRVLVIGASSGIGRELARALAGQGSAVVGAARRLHRIAELEGVHALECDVSNPPAASAVVEDAVAILGGLDAVVYATGVTRITPLQVASAADWSELFATNVFGAALVMRAALPHLLQADSEGRVIVLTSDSAQRPYPGLVIYGAAKAALAAFAAGLQGELPDLRVTEMIVGPTAGTEVGDRFDPDDFGEWATRWFDEGYIRYGMLQVSDVVATIVETLAADQPLSTVWATGPESTQTLDETREIANSGSAASGSKRGRKA